MTAIGKYKHLRISCIPCNFEKYISFSLGNLRFIDSLQFLNSSLQKLVENLSKEGEGGEKFQHLTSQFPQNREILLKKGIYPYDYVDSPNKLEDTCLPSKEAFYSQLFEEHISDDNYNHAKQIWNTFKCKTLGDYHDLYLKTDVILLTDVFENFRTVCMKAYKLDPAHYYTSPGLSWDSMLKFTKIKLQLITNIDMYLMVESGLRGGISVISQKHAEANNSEVEGYDDTKPNSFITYLDANNLYGMYMYYT